MVPGLAVLLSDAGAVDVSKAFDFAAQTSIQLLTLSTGLVALLLTYASGPGQSRAPRARRLLIGSWMLFLLSILFGVGALMAMTGSLAQGRIDVYAPSIRTYASLQILCFMVGLGLAIAYGVVATTGVKPAADRKSSDA